MNVSPLLLDDLHFRVRFLIFSLFILFAIYAGKIIYFTVKQRDVIPRKSITPSISSSKIRRNITDRNGVLLATTLPIISIAVNPHKINFKIEVAKALNKVFVDLDLEILKQKLFSEKKFVWIKRNVTPNEEKLVTEAGISGLLFENDSVRIYPNSNRTAFVLGYADTDLKGIAGIEKTFDKELSKGGSEHLKLTIDLRLQTILTNSLRNQIELVKAEGGSGILMNVKNGEILAMVSLPDFNPHKISQFGNDELFNRATLGVYELGSVFKPITAAYLLDSHSIKLHEVFDVSSPLKIGKYSIHDFISSTVPYIDIETILVKSSNVGTARAALRGGLRLQQEYFKKFGLLDAVDIDIPEKSTPIWSKKWVEINLVTMSYGHGIAVTPMHLASAISAIVNGGMKCRPHLNLDQSSECSPVISRETSAIMNKILRQVVSRGSGRKADVEGLCVGGKTGTGSKLHGGRYSKSQSIASFVGAFPMYDPEYLLFISIDNPKGVKLTTTGGFVAAPVAGEILSKILPIINFVKEPERCFFE